MSPDIRLLVRADDAGSSFSSNVGCFLACTDGIARSVEIMMPCPWVSHAATLFNERPEIDIGIHLTLTSEWDAVKWRPLTHAPSLTDDNGFFLPLVMPRGDDDRPCLANANWSIDEIVNEFSAQMSLGISMFGSASHISSHMLRHFKDFDPKLGDVIADLCAKFGLKDDAFGYGLPRLEGYPKLPRDADHRTAAFVDQIAELEAGTYIFIDHPAVASAELDATGHEGYEDVAEDRRSCLDTLRSNRLMQRINDLSIELISYKDL